MENSVKGKSSIAFIVELFLLFAILIFTITVITQVFMKTRTESLKARHLTEAVIAAESTAEVLSAASDEEDAVKLLEGMDNASDVKPSESGFDLKVSCDSGDVYDVRVTEEQEKGKTGTYTARTVEVSLSGTEEELYTLKTGDYDKSNGRGEE